MTWGASWGDAFAGWESTQVVPSGTTMRLSGHSIGYGGVAYGAIQVYSSATVTATAEAANSGGWFPHPRRKTREEIDAERERLGIIPPKVQAIVRKEAKRSVAKAREEIAERPIALPPISTEQLIEAVGPVTGIGRDLSIMLALGEMRRGQELKAEMARQQIAWQARYEYELQLEIERLIQEQQDREDEQIVTLLFQRYMH